MNTELKIEIPKGKLLVKTPLPGDPQLGVHSKDTPLTLSLISIKQLSSSETVQQIFQSTTFVSTYILVLVYLHTCAFFPGSQTTAEKNFQLTVKGKKWRQHGLL